MVWPKAWRIAGAGGLVAGLLFSGLSFGMFLTSPLAPDEQRIAFLAVGVMIAWAGIWMFRETRADRVVVTDEGIEWDRAWRPGRVRLAWSDVVDVRFSAVQGAFILKAADRPGIRVGGLHVGVGRFLMQVEERVSPAALDGDHNLQKRMAQARRDAR